GKLAQLSQQGVLALLSDSTRVESPGYTPSEKIISDTLDTVFSNAPGRLIVATFASLIARVQQVIDLAVKYERHVGVVGRSMINNVAMAQELGYLQVPPGVLQPTDALAKLPHDKIVVICTGA